MIQAKLIALTEYYTEGFWIPQNTSNIDLFTMANLYNLPYIHTYLKDHDQAC